MTAHELVNTFKYMGSIMKATAQSIKHKSQEIDKYKKVLIKLSKYTLLVIVTSYVIIFKEMFYSSIQKSSTDGDIVASAIFSALLSIVLTIVTMILYAGALIILWLLYITWKLIIRKKPKKKNEIQKDEPNDVIIIDVRGE